MAPAKGSGLRTQTNRPVVRSVRRRLVRRGPPLRATVIESASSLRIANHGDMAALGVFALGFAMVLGGAGLWFVRLSPYHPMPQGVWLPLVLVGSVVALIGLWAFRCTDECVITPGSQGLVFSHRGPWRREERHFRMTDLSLLLHSVELHRRGSHLPSWRGYALCLWCGDEFLMAFTVTKDEPSCVEFLERIGAAATLYEGRGELLLGSC